MDLDEDLPEWSAQGPVIELAGKTCWDLIRGSGVGRLVVSAADSPEIFPVDYYSEAGSVVFRTASETMLHSLAVNGHVVFEIDSLSPALDWSVIVKGVATVEDSAYVNRSAEDALPLWRPVSVYHFVEIIPESISGRRFERGHRVARMAAGTLLTRPEPRST
jgi:hypothetical protein